jgi:hypothetical protein
LAESITGRISERNVTRRPQIYGVKTIREKAGKEIRIHINIYKPSAGIVYNPTKTAKTGYNIREL